MSSGWYSLHRGWFENPIFQQRTYCERAAWVWLIEHACWQPKKVRVAGKIITLERGQMSYSRRFLAKAWHWHESRVQRFLNALQIGQAIGQASEQGQRVITICNYAKYQDHGNLANQPPNQQQDSQRTSSEPNKNKDNKETTNNLIECATALGEVLFKGNKKEVPFALPIALSPDFELEEEWGAHAEQITGFSERDILVQSRAFAFYFTKGSGSGKKKTADHWFQSWDFWMKTALEKRDGKIRREEQKRVRGPGAKNYQRN